MGCIRCAPLFDLMEEQCDAIKALQPDVIQKVFIFVL